MQILSLLEPIDDYSNATAGFRLQRFEVLNWGTFNERIWVIDLDGKTALLTGANGSGKSTLVDALLTLMVPNKSRNYNKASSASNKKERDEKSYVQGAYSRTRSEESYGSKPKFLRVKKEPSILLAYFNNCVTKKDVTLAQVLWIENGSVQKLFILADIELTIQNNFGLFKNIEELKKQLQTDKVECFKEFSKYSQQFRKRFGLQSPKALDLFNQIVSVKEIGSLNEFVRSQMLEKTDTQNNIRDLQKSFEDLTVCQAKIESASNQLNALIPIVEESEKHKNIHSEITNLEKYKSFLPAFFAREKNNLLENRLKNIEQSLMQITDEVGECDNQLETLGQKAIDLNLEILQDANGLRLKALTQEIELSQKEINRRKKEAEEYDRLAQQLELPAYADSDIFYSARTKGEELKENIEAILKELDEKKDGKKEKRRELQKQKTELDSELQSLRSRKSQIPDKNLKIRNRLVADLNLNENDLPFVGELLRVRPEAKEWEGVIERLLSSFGLYILVPEVHYQSTNAYIRKTNLGGRLTYFRVQPNPTSVIQRASDPKRIPHKLEIKPENKIFFEWLQSRLAKQYNYLCCETIEQFHHEIRAVTREGLIKHDTERHEKNDTYPIDDSKKYILGWDNLSKIKALESELTNINQRLDDVEKEINILKGKEGQSNQQKEWLRDFMKFTDFSAIDWHTKEKEMVELQQEKKQLEDSSDQLKELEKQLEIAESDIKEFSKRRDTLMAKKTTLEIDQQGAEKEKDHCTKTLQTFTNSEIEAFQKWGESELKQYKMTLLTINQDEKNMQNNLQEKIKQKEKVENDAKSSIEKKMVSFTKTFIEESLELDSSMEDIGNYLKLKNKIEEDNLPRYEKEFKELINDKIISFISIFQNNLNNREEEIKEAIDKLNDSLKRIDYTDSTYIELRYEKSRDREIRDFRDSLKTCLGDAARYSAEDNEERFQNIKTLLIERFKNQERWTELVTDVRNWLDFSVIERYRSDNVEKEHHTDSSGKSGGQKAKLAYTILASAIAYQFGLNQDDEKYKSFRFVVIDEIFSKLDQENARYVMELFKNLHLQLLLVTPKDKISLIESYISNLHLVSIIPDKDESRIIPISIEDYRNNRQTLINSSYD